MSIREDFYCKISEMFPNKPRSGALVFVKRAISVFNYLCNRSVEDFKAFNYGLRRIKSREKQDVKCLI
jgi:hypothetical protein